MTQSAASAVIAALEREFGSRLFHRVGRGIALTEGGQLLLGESRALLNRAEATMLAMREVSGLARGRLAIKASQTIANHLLPARLVEFHQTYPGIALAVTVGNSTQVAQAILRGEVELGFIEGPEAEMTDANLATELIAHDTLVMVVATGHRWASRTRFDAADLAAGTWVVREDGSGTRAVFFRAMAELGVPADQLGIAIELPSNQAVVAAVLAGAGAAILSERACSSELAAGLLMRLPVALGARAFYAVQHVDRYRSRAVAAFLAMLCQSAYTNGH